MFDLFYPDLVFESARELSQQPSVEQPSVERLLKSCPHLLSLQKDRGDPEEIFPQNLFLGPGLLLNEDSNKKHKKKVKKIKVIFIIVILTRDPIKNPFLFF